MTLKITHKHSTTAGTPPAAGDIDVGELAINAADVELYTKDTSGAVQAVNSYFTQSGTGATRRLIESKLQDVVSVKDFGAVGDGVTDDTAAIQSAITAVLAGNRALHFPSGTYSVNPDKQLGPILQFTYSGALRLTGDNATISNKSFSRPSADQGDIVFRASDGATTTLTVDAADQDTTITVADATGIVAGQLIRLDSADQPISERNYGKHSVMKVALVTGNVITLSDPLNWWFTAAETTVKTFDYASCTMRGISYTVNVPPSTDPFDVDQMGAKIGFTFLQDSEYSDATVLCPALNDGRAILFASNYNVYNRDLIIKNGSYSIQYTKTRNILVERVQASDCRHPLDPAEWCFNVIVKNLHGTNTQNALQCHPCFDVNFIDCTDQNDYQTGGMGLRCLGGSYVNCTIVAPVSTYPGSGVSLKSEYNDIRLNYNRLYKDTTALGGRASASGSYAMYVENCKFYDIYADVGQSSSKGLSVLSVDEDTTTVSSLNRATRLQQVRSARETILIDTPLDVSTFADEGSGTFVSSETFVVDPRAIPSLGFYPNTKFRAVMYENSSTSGPNSIKIPVKIIDPFDYGRRRGQLDMWLRVYTSRGLVTARYQGSYRQPVTSDIQLNNRYIDSTDGIATAEITNIACNFISQGASNYYNGDYFYTFDVEANCNTPGTAAIYSVEVTVLDTKVRS